MKTKITKLVTTDLDEWTVGEDNVQRIWFDDDGLAVNMGAYFVEALPERTVEGDVIQVRYVFEPHAVKMTVQEANHGRAR